jgi:hypothetical protein
MKALAATMVLCLARGKELEPHAILPSRTKAGSGRQLVVPYALSNQLFKVIY